MTPTMDVDKVLSEFSLSVTYIPFEGDIWQEKYTRKAIDALRIRWSVELTHPRAGAYKVEYTQGLGRLPDSAQHYLGPATRYTRHYCDRLSAILAARVGVRCPDTWRKHYAREGKRAMIYDAEPPLRDVLLAIINDATAVSYVDSADDMIREGLFQVDSIASARECERVFEACRAAERYLFQCGLSIDDMASLREALDQ